METYYSIKAVIFDFDGTLTKPGSLDFPRIKTGIGCPSGEAILEYIDCISDPVTKKKAVRVLDRFELEAAAASAPNAGAEEVLAFLRHNNVHVVIISRNSRKAILTALNNFTGTGPDDFDLIISRDESHKPKPSPEGILHAAELLGIQPQEIIMVGDHTFDIHAGKQAGARTVFLSNGLPCNNSSASDGIIRTLEELIPLVRMDLPLSPGKLPPDVLDFFLSRRDMEDSSLLIQPGIGEDCAAMDISEEEVLVLTSDPITFTTASMGEYAVTVNANDIATTGATPRWLLTTLLFPPGMTATVIGRVMEELMLICRKWGIILCGGHTEITDAVTRPVITGMLAGTVEKNSLIEKQNMKQGDAILLTKGVAVEGTAIIAMEREAHLRELGLTEDEIAEGKGFLSGISIIEEARIARTIHGVTAMHDVTEGGLATACEELSVAGGHVLSIRTDDIPIFPLTEKICRVMEIDPLGLIGSGSLIICCHRAQAEVLMKKIRDAGIDVCRIGEVGDPGRGVIATRGPHTIAWPRFTVDEIARVFGSTEHSY